MKSKKLLSALMAAVMLISTLSVGFYAIAEDNVDTSDTAVSDAEDKITVFSDYADSLFSTDSENYDAAVTAYEEAAEAILGIGLDLAEGSDVSSADVLESYDKINSLSDSARAFFDAVAENSSIQLGATLNTAIEFNESTTAQNAYNNTPTITYITVSDVMDSFDAYVDDLNFNEFVEYVASVDVDSRTTEQIAKAQELYAALSSDKKNAIDDDTYNKFLEIIVPLKDTTDYADVIAAFEPTAFVRPPESSVAWTEGGIQSFADNLENLFSPGGLLSTFGIDFDLVQAAGKVDGYGILLDHSLLGGTPTGLEIWKIEASAGEGGSMDPSGTVELKQADSKRFTITADVGNTIYSLTVNG